LFAPAPGDKRRNPSLVRNAKTLRILAPRAKVPDSRQKTHVFDNSLAQQYYSCQ
jgi:hypothetical protein